MQDLDPNEFYRSSDMGVVTYLMVEGHTTQKVFWDNGTCYWVFRINDALLEHLELYQGDLAQVDPREYNRRYAEVKREFYSTRAQAQSTGRTA